MYNTQKTFQIYIIQLNIIFDTNTFHLQKSDILERNKKRSQKKKNVLPIIDVNKF